MHGVTGETDETTDSGHSIPTAVRVRDAMGRGGKELIPELIADGIRRYRRAGGGGGEWRGIPRKPAGDRRCGRKGKPSKKGDREKKKKSALDDTYPSSSSSAGILGGGAGCVVRTRPTTLSGEGVTGGRRGVVVVARTGTTVILI